MMKFILSALLCFCFLAATHPAGAAGNTQPDVNPHEAKAKQAVTEKITKDERAAAQMMEMLDMMKMLKQLDLMEDYEIVGENENEKSR